MKKKQEPKFFYLTKNGYGEEKMWKTRPTKYSDGYKNWMHSCNHIFGGCSDECKWSMDLPDGTIFLLTGKEFVFDDEYWPFRIEIKNNQGL